MKTWPNTGSLWEHQAAIDVSFVHKIIQKSLGRYAKLSIPDKNLNVLAFVPIT